MGAFLPVLGFPLLTQKRLLLQPWHFVALFRRDIRAKCGISSSPYSPEIGQKSHGDILISGFLVNPLQIIVVITPEPSMIMK